MSLVLIGRFFRDSRWLGLAAISGIFLFEIILAKTISEFDTSAIEAVLKIPFVARAWKTLLGSDVVGMISGTGLASIGAAHPFVYLVSAAVLLSECTRVIVGEIDRGSADMLLGLPTTRVAIYLSSTFVWMAWGAALCLTALLGLRIGVQLSPLFEPVDFPRILALLPNMFALYCAIGGLATGVSAFLTRRGRAVAIVLAYLLISFAVNFLAQIWAPMGWLARCGVLYYYQPLEQVKSGAIAWDDIGILVAIGGIAWIAGLIRYTTRDIPA